MTDPVVTQEDRRSSGQVFELLDAEQLTPANVHELFALHRIAAEQATRAKVVDEICAMLDDWSDKTLGQDISPRFLHDMIRAQFGGQHD